MLSRSAYGLIIVLVFAADPTSSARLRPSATRAQSSSPQRSSSIVLAQPEHVVVSANGRMVAYVRGDVLWAQPLGPDGTPRSAPIQVSTGMNDSGKVRDFEGLSPDGSRLVFRTGHGGFKDRGELCLAVLKSRDGHPGVRPLVQGDIAARLQTFMHLAAGGAAWSHDGRHVAFLARDATRDQHLQVYVADAETGDVERWTDDSTWKFSVAWSPDGRSLAVSTGDVNFALQTATILVLNSPGDSREIVQVRAHWLSDLLWSPDGAWLLAARDGVSLVDIGVPLLLHVAPDGSARVEEAPLPRLRFVAFTPDGSGLLARRAEGMSARLVLVDRSNGRASVLTPGDMLFSPIGIGGSPGNAVAVFTAESGAITREVRVAKIAAHATKLLGTTVVARSVGSPRGGMPFSYRVFRWTSPKGDSLEAKLYRPRRKAAGSPPPLVVVPYGRYRNTFDDPGFFLESLLWELMRHGWAVAFPNTRCAANDETCVGHYGDVQLEDTERMIEALGTRRLIDPHRVALIGHSHGGSLAYYYVTHSARFCATVAVNGRTDLEAQARFGDAYLVGQMGGTPSDVPDTYARFSPLRHAAAVTTPLLAVAGKMDTQILPANASAFASALKAANKRVELLEFPDEGHLIVKPENVRRFWNAVFGLLDGSCRATRAD